MRDISKTETLDLGADVTRLQSLLKGLSRIRPLRDPIADSLEQMGLTGPQLHSILALGGDGALTMGELGKRLGVSDKTITGLVDRLERDGHVQRERDPEDRRVVRCRLTRAGAALFRKMEASITEKMTRLLGLLDARDRRDMFRILENIIARLTELRGQSLSPKEDKS